MARALVVVTTYQRPNLLGMALRAWRRQSTPDFTLAIADDGSGDETRDLVMGFAQTAPFRVVHAWHEHDGFRRAAVINHAVREGGEAPLVIVTDGDCLPPATFVARHVAAHEPRSFAVGGAIRLDRATSESIGEADIDAGRFEGLGTAADRRDLRRRAWKSRWGVRLGHRRRPKILGLNFAVDRALFEEVNGFDEAFVGYGLEDSDLRDRLMRTRPRPRVKVLYGKNDVWHLWHPPAATTGEKANLGYYRTERPVRCERGLARVPVTSRA
jgi:glycosyltransferase involved in cell wall biosynthesis